MIDGFARLYSGEIQDLFAIPEDDHAGLSRSERGPVGIGMLRLSAVGLGGTTWEVGSVEGIRCLKPGPIAERGPDGMLAGIVLSGV